MAAMRMSARLVDERKPRNQRRSGFPPPEASPSRLTRSGCRLALANDLGRRLEHTERLAFAACVASQDAKSDLLRHVLDAPHHLVEFADHGIDYLKRIIADLRVAGQAPRRLPSAERHPRGFTEAWPAPTVL